MIPSCLDLMIFKYLYFTLKIQKAFKMLFKAEIAVRSFDDTKLQYNSKMVSRF
jgi:hypothetical protein